MRHGISCVHGPGRRAGDLRRAPDPEPRQGRWHARQRGPETAARLWRAGVPAATAAIAVLAAACGGSSPTAAAHPLYQKELAYAQCMRAHGDPGFPDPQSDGSFNTTKANRGALAGPRAQPANKACAHLQGPRTTPVQFQQGVSQALKFAACIRAHGITSFPQPEVNRNKETSLLVSLPPAASIPTRRNSRPHRKLARNSPLPARTWVTVNREPYCFCWRAAAQRAGHRNPGTRGIRSWWVVGRRLRPALPGNYPVSSLSARPGDPPRLARIILAGSGREDPRVHSPPGRAQLPTQP